MYVLGLKLYFAALNKGQNTAALLSIIYCPAVFLHQSKHSGHKGGCCTSEVCVSHSGLLTERTHANAQGLIYRKVIKQKETCHFLCP